jgi:hypothetical protein
MAMFGKLIRREEGAVLVMVAAGMAVLLGFLALVADVGFLYLNRVQLVNAADAAALAGVWHLPGEPGEAKTVAREYARKNGQADDQIQVQTVDGDYGLQVRIQRQVDLFFAPMVGIDRGTVGAAETARIWGLDATNNVVPLGVVEQNFEFGYEYVLKAGSITPGAPYTGNYGALSLGGTGAKVYENNLKTGYTGILRVGDRVYTEPGNMVGPTRKGVEHRISRCSHGGFENCIATVDCPRVVVVPIIDRLNVPGRSEQVTILGFAVFYLQGVKSGEITGRFIRRLVDGEKGDVMHFGAVVAALVD